MYRQALPPWIETIRERDPGHVYHLFPVRTPEREALRAHLGSSGIETLIHYPIALTDQPAFESFRAHACPVAAAAAREVLSLPLHPRLADGDVRRVARAVDAFQKGLTPA
jgi:dTDP-4-amino-4,6-dideoxygalactose transaminase